MDSITEPSHIILAVAFAIASFFLKRLANSIDVLERELQDLKEKVAILIDRDRRKRLEDYEKEK